MKNGFTYIGMSEKFKYVSKVICNGKIKYRGTGISGVNTKMFNTEREAAIAVDKILILKGKEPINILIRKP